LALLGGLDEVTLAGAEPEVAGTAASGLRWAAAISLGAWARLGVLGIAVCLAAGYALGAWPGFWYQSVPGGASAFWAPAGLTLAALVLTPRRTWPLWLAAFAAAEFGVDVVHHEAMSLALGDAVANIAEPLVGALLLTRWVRSTTPSRVNLLAFVTCAVVAGPLVGAVLGATATTVFPPSGQGWWEVVGTWWLGDSLGVLVVGSLLLTWARRPRSHYRAPIAATFAMSVAAAGAIIVTAVLWHAPVILGALPVLVWAAFAGGATAVMTVGAAVAAATDWAALTGRTSGLLAGASPPHDLAVLQCFLGLTLLTAMVLNIEIDERRDKEEHARRTEEAAVRVAEAERHSISQDTHDIVGHGLAAMLLQLGAARQVLDGDPRQALDLLASAETIGRGACQDLEVALNSLGQGAVRAPGLGLAALPGLVDALSDAGLPVSLHVDEGALDPPTLVDWSAYRLVREALTNVVRHAPGAPTTVTVRVHERELVVSVVNDATPDGTTPGRPEGRGIVGMRERAEALGGTLEVDQRRDGGFAVVASLPW
jgi:signal transduction histidine kinase